MVDQESHTTRLARTLCGDVPQINSVGILSAANPRGTSLSPGENIARNRALQDALVTYGITQIRGSYGGLVNPFIVANITREWLLDLGTRFKQERVILGQRHCEDEDTRMIFGLLATGVQDDAETVIAERQLILPVRRVDHPQPRVDGRPFTIPYFDDDNAQDVELHGAQVLTYRREEVPGTPEAQETLNRFLARDRLLTQVLAAQQTKNAYTGHYLYQRRGDQNLRLIELHKLMGNWRSFPFFSSEHTW